MKKISTKVIAVLLVVLMAAVYVPVGELSSVFTVEASAATSSGSLGDNVKWSYDTKTKVITVSGSGAMKDFKSATDGQNFHKLVVGSTQYPNKDATKIVINDGVTYIGQNAFRNLTGVKEVSIPSSVTSIGKSAFEGCSALTTVNLTESLTSIGAYAFKKTKFAAVKMPYSVKTIGEYAFSGISGLKITCNYGDAAYNYCKTYNAAYTLRTPSVICDTSFDAAKSQVVLAVKVKDASGLNAANFTVNYSSVLKPVSTDSSVDDLSSDSDLKTAVVYNETGKISIACLAKECLPYAACADECSYTVATLKFKVNGEDDTADFTVTPTAVMANGSRVAVANATKSVNLHTYQETSVTPATCNAEGVRVYTCTLCGKVKKETIAKDPANHEGGTELRNAVAASCNAAGYSGDTVCLGCGAVIATGTQIEKLSHSYVAGETVAPTCTQDGYTVYTCSVCGDVYQGNIVPAAHQYQAVVTAPTCRTKGYTTYTCSVCGDSYVGDETGLGAHDYKAVVTPATCQSKGYTTYTCSVCGDSYVADETAKGGHDYQAVVTEPTCTQAGYTIYTCSVCGDSYRGDVVSALGHSYDADGVCTRCGDVNVTTVTFTDESYRADEETGIVISTSPSTAQALLDAIASGKWTLETADGAQLDNEAAITSGSVLKGSGGKTYRVVILGDVDLDGTVTAADARLALRGAANLEQLDDIQSAAADCDAEKGVSAQDARMILRVSAHLDVF